MEIRPNARIEASRTCSSRRPPAPILASLVGAAVALALLSSCAGGPKPVAAKPQAAAAKSAAKEPSAQ
jgi:hypothetical protein